MQYDARNQVTLLANGAGDEIRRTYDAQGNLLSETTGAGTPGASTTAYTYDDGNRITDKVVDPQVLALHTHYEYDLFGNVVSQTRPNGYAAAQSDASWALQVRAQLGMVDAAGEALTAAELSDAQRAAIAQAFTAHTEYDAMNRAVRTTD